MDFSRFLTTTPSRARNAFAGVVLASAALLVGCTPFGERTSLSVGFYTVSGDTFQEVDQQLALHGPNVSGVGKALAATSIRMSPNIALVPNRGGCKVGTARVTVQARVTLPRHANYASLKADLAKAWTDLSRYARVHEEVHVAIADKYALEMEKSVRRLPVAPDCNVLQQQVNAVLAELRERHQQEQNAFDESERIRIERLLAERSAASNTDAS